jgi:fimbrial chaperone protein
MLKALSVSRCVTIALLSLGITTSALGSSLSVSPVVVSLDATTRTAAITLKNESSESRVIQTELLRWTQANGEDIHAPSRDLLVNPPIATLQPGQSQIIRVGLNRKADKTQELAYRLYISEVPPPPKEGFTGLRIALRLGLAVFVAPSAKPIEKVEWKAALNPQGTLHLGLHNGGNRHVRLTSLKIRDPGNGKQLAELQQSQLTLLAGQARQISLPLPTGWRGRQISLMVGTEEGVAEAKVQLEQPAR